MACQKTTHLRSALFLAIWAGSVAISPTLAFAQEQQAAVTGSASGSASGNTETSLQADPGNSGTTSIATATGEGSVSLNASIPVQSVDVSGQETGSQPLAGNLGTQTALSGTNELVTGVSDNSPNAGDVPSAPTVSLPSGSPGAATTAAGSVIGSAASTTDLASLTESGVGESVEAATRAAISSDIASSVSATVQDDIRSAIQADIVTDVVGSLPLLGNN